MANIGKKEIVKMLLKNKELENEDEEQLMEILFNEPIAIDADKVSEDQATWKDRLADKVTEYCGSWSFIIWFLLIIAVWIIANYFLYEAYGSSFDPYPYILLNLALFFHTKSEIHGVLYPRSQYELGLATFQFHSKLEPPSC